MSNVVDLTVEAPAGTVRLSVEPVETAQLTPAYQQELIQRLANAAQAFFDDEVTTS